MCIISADRSHCHTVSIPARRHDPPAEGIRDERIYTEPPWLNSWRLTVPTQNGPNWP